MPRPGPSVKLSIMPPESAPTPWDITSLPNLVAADLDRKTFPLLHEYLASLPKGLQSYPQCRTISGFFTCMQSCQPRVWQDPRLPSHLRDLLNHKPAAGSFMPTVLSSCQSIVWRDLMGIGEVDYLEEAHRIMWEVLSGPLYRASLNFLSPHIVLLNAGKRWNLFVEGTELRSLGGTKSRHILSLKAPAGLYPGIWCTFFANNFAETLRRVHARQPEVSARRKDATEILFELSWEG